MADPQNVATDRQSQIAQESDTRVVDVVEIIASIIRVEPLEQLFDRMLRVIARNFDMKGMSMGILDESTGLYSHKACYGYPPDVVRKIRNVAYTQDRMENDLREEFKIARNTYYVRNDDKSMAYDDDLLFVTHPEWVDKPRKSPDDWHELDYIDFLMTDKNGRTIGWLEITEPANYKVPSKNVLDSILVIADLGAIAIENAKLYEEAVKSMNESRHYVDLITHEMNNLVRPLEHLTRELRSAAEHDSKSLDIALNMTAIAKSMRSLIDTVKKYSDARQSRSVTLRPHDLRDVMRRTADYAKREIAQKQFELNLAKPAGECVVMADELINDMFLNIFLDAARRTQGHYVTVDAAIREAHGVYTVTLSDRGSTIPDDIRDKVLAEPGTRIGDLKFSDVGLSLAALVAKRFDGIVSVRDRHQGTDSPGMTFEISLPKAK